MNRKYTVDLADLQRNGETIYVLLSRLMPMFETGREREIELGPETSTHSLVLRIVETTPYTSVVEVVPDNTEGWLKGFEMQIRAYHDAKIAEVIRCEKLHRILPKYPYPNSRMLLPDEKAQLHRFVKEWFLHIDQHGRDATPFIWKGTDD